MYGGSYLSSFHYHLIILSEKAEGNIRCIHIKPLLRPLIWAGYVLNLANQVVIVLAEAGETLWRSLDSNAFVFPIEIILLLPRTKARG